MQLILWHFDADQDSWMLLARYKQAAATLKEDKRMVTLTDDGDCWSLFNWTFRWTERERLDGWRDREHTDHTDHQAGNDLGRPLHKRFK